MYGLSLSHLGEWAMVRKGATRHERVRDEAATRAGIETCGIGSGEDHS